MNLGKLFLLGDDDDDQHRDVLPSLAMSSDKSLVASPEFVSSCVPCIVILINKRGAILKWCNNSTTPVGRWRCGGGVEGNENCLPDKAVGGVNIKRETIHSHRNVSEDPRNDELKKHEFGEKLFLLREDDDDQHGDVLPSLAMSSDMSLVASPEFVSSCVPRIVILINK
ncbi:hypothetical protein CEXT_241481 [Caerostris extrusa]|uniref:Uncharacterized protein n=1 Tax=Caerostris extrusa TaxID=172846 RepID=A0AAV4TI88_CAEEX|nr:hypothetical protein CEXT_241481 [Caerostris extrusa]